MKYFFFFITSILFAQQTQFIDFRTATGKIIINPKEKTVSGTATYSFEVIKPTDTIRIDAKNMAFSEVQLNSKDCHFVVNKNELLLIFPFKEGTNSLSFQYTAKPKQSMYFLGNIETDNLQIWTQGQGKETSHWFPSFDDVNEKIIFELEITFNKNYEIISNGVLKSKTIDKDNIIWNYQMKKPMSSYLLMVVAGKFSKKQQTTKSKVPMLLYSETSNESQSEPTYRYSKNIFDFLEKEIAVKYPWEIYKQVPVRDFIYGGMENTTATVFSTHYVVDSIGFADRNYCNVNAHELAHQWFGDLVTAQNSKEHWLNEGFATYYALLAEKKLFGNDYFYYKLYEIAQQLEQASSQDNTPILSDKASTLAVYKKGAWALVILRENLGEKKFRKVISNYLKKYAFLNVNTELFFDEIQKLSSYNLISFREKWLESTGFDKEEAQSFLKKNKTLETLLELENLRNKPFLEKLPKFEKIINSNVFYGLKIEVIKQISKENYEDIKPLLISALKDKNIFVRQTIALCFPKIPIDFRENYETLLEDKSYFTQEIALYNLWNNFPEKQVSYLEKTKNWKGFNDMNLRILWISLAITTKNYSENKNQLIDELILYSSQNYESSTRKNAFEYLELLDFSNETVLQNLINATTHHYSSFSKYAKERLEKLKKDENQRINLEKILPNLPENEQFVLKKILSN